MNPVVKVLLKCANRFSILLSLACISEFLYANVFSTYVHVRISSKASATAGSTFSFVCFHLWHATYLSYLNKFWAVVHMAYVCNVSFPCGSVPRQSSHHIIFPQQLVEAIVLPMTHKERFENLGIQPPKGTVHPRQTLLTSLLTMLWTT